MLTYLTSQQVAPEQYTQETKSPDVLKESVWIDLFSPSKIEEQEVEQYLDSSIPSREDMIEIELSSRLYKEKSALFMTALMIAQSDSPDPKLEPVTFVLTDEQLITVRYVESQTFKLFTAQVKKMTGDQKDAITLLMTLLEAAIDRLADILESIGNRLELFSKKIFRPHDATQKLNYQALLQDIGANGELNTKARESLVTFNRLVLFFSQTAHTRISPEGVARLETLSKDVLSLSDHANFLSAKVNFLLDATLGMVSIEQNNIIKIFSVAAVIFLPPTLVASIYGMNFHFMPELSWKYGYLFATGMILFAAWVPYKYFKHRKWL